MREKNKFLSGLSHYNLGLCSSQANLVLTITNGICSEISLHLISKDYKREKQNTLE